MAEEGNCALECMDKLASAWNALKWIPKTKTDLSIKGKVVNVMQNKQNFIR